MTNAPEEVIQSTAHWICLVLQTTFVDFSISTIQEYNKNTQSNLEWKIIILDSSMKALLQTQKFLKSISIRKYYDVILCQAS